MLGCGTASHAALAGTYLFSRIAKKHINFSIGSEFNYLEDYLTKESLLIPISQSGETIDVVEPVEKAKKKGAKIAAIVNVLGSTLYREADYKILLGAGVEKAVVGTKSFIAMISVLLLTAYTLAKKEDLGKRLLLRASQNLKKVLGNKFVENLKKIAGELKNNEHIYIIGRGLSYATALEATLKIKETSYIHAEGFAGGELKHGVIALIERGTPCIVFAPNDETHDDIISNAWEVKARGGFIIGIGPRDNKVFERFLKTDDIGDATIIPQVVISQLLAYYLALEKGIKDPDKPRNLAKSVTVK
jgi:glucosamine--fructose-6-phosphate aminotransferase (isomerizing)